MAKYTNTGAGARGIVTTDGNTVWIEPGQTVELDKNDGNKVHEDIKEGAAAAKEAAADPLDHDGDGRKGGMKGAEPKS